MANSTQDLAAAFAQEANHELEQAANKIRHCVTQLSDEQVWWRPAESMNSIANLILHLCGNVRQWIVSGVGGAADNRDRSKEFSERGPIPSAELLARLDAVLAEAQAAIAAATPAELLRLRRIQAKDVTGLRAILHVVAHFQGHTQEIVHLTRSQLADCYRFDFVPATGRS